MVLFRKRYYSITKFSSTLEKLKIYNYYTIQYKISGNGVQIERISSDPLYIGENKKIYTMI